MTIPILGPLFGFLGNLSKSYMERKMVEAEGKIAIAKARAEAQATIAVTTATADIQRDQTLVEASAKSWKDEFWTILLAIPVIMAFIPQTRKAATDGFNAIADLPEWYLISLGVAISFAFGSRKVGEAFSAIKGRKS